ncbi:putative alpha/beta hydrolase [Stakelama sediminis]|uniref:Putative alpha/beta hydrolase n=1 Tax=Stakelama sediminis TaxID=463200 RepID=A0A840YVI2_9SPHN|nr:putative alpha/beta hydrolase [Stakelama sediminis]
MADPGTCRSSGATGCISDSLTGRSTITAKVLECDMALVNRATAPISKAGLAVLIQQYRGSANDIVPVFHERIARP